MIKLDALNKSFADVHAVRDLNLEIEPGEFLCLLGSSGCGKSTTLRMIAGFVRPDSGRVLIDGADVTGYGADARPTAMVFQDYAIFPHLTVAENVEFGLKAHRLPKPQRAPRVSEVLDMVGLDGLADRRPGELSGGQQQRVAVARAMAVRPSVLLMDEPLSNLDAKTRVHLRTQLRTIQRETGTTVVYVTHDQEEALALGDRIAVMKDGSLEQLGTGRELYRLPRTRYVADFVGVTNWLTAKLVTETEDGWQVATADTAFLVTPGVAPGPITGPGAVDVSLRPESITISPPGASVPGRQALPGVVRDEQFLGAVVRTIVEVGEHQLIVHSASGGWRSGQPVKLIFGPDDARAFPSGDQDRHQPPAEQGRTAAGASTR
ncbi:MULTISPECIES: ABC transporter ATP-binding protein [Micromonospora]|uniref:ABC transporter ATP-binding protein n=1 Tax=Micromonospora TaxID=1873 RepID=UPI000D6FF49E|nr:ABC transporter ATP-binding protein [Micromonospora sp. S4605]PWU56472.1 spermidine/putrescine ABC transporter ATP-binding protein [Micromonospora sp. S4605]